MPDDVTPAIAPFPTAPDPRPDRVSARLRAALGMQLDGLNMLRETMKRRFPEDTPAQRQSRISDWLAYTPEIDDPRYEVRPCKAPSNNCSEK